MRFPARWAMLVGSGAVVVAIPIVDITGFAFVTDRVGGAVVMVVGANEVTYGLADTGTGVPLLDSATLDLETILARRLTFASACSTSVHAPDLLFSFGGSVGASVL